MPIRNPFARKVGVSYGLESAQDEINKPGFERVDTRGSKTSSTMSINSATSQELVEYKLSGTVPYSHIMHAPSCCDLPTNSIVQVADHCEVVNDYGIYLPPSPPEEKSLWSQRSKHSNASTNTSSSLAEIEPFPISRESFDSYRRSFDISARSPIIANDNRRQSLDSARLPRLPRSAIGERRFEREPPTEEEGFEEVGLNDELSKPKRRGFFSKFGDPQEPGIAIPITSRFHITGRKRGQSGQGAELRNIERPGTSGSIEVEEVH